MGAHALYVRFPDGEIRFGLYHSASDTASPHLFTTLGAAFSHAPAWGLHYPPHLEGSGEIVEVASAYAGYFWWRATATRDWLTSHRDPFETAQTTDGAPHWRADYFAQCALEEHPAETVALDRAERGH